MVRAAPQAAEGPALQSGAALGAGREGESMVPDQRDPGLSASFSQITPAMMTASQKD